MISAAIIVQLLIALLTYLSTPAGQITAARTQAINEKILQMFEKIHEHFMSQPDPDIKPPVT